MSDIKEKAAQTKALVGAFAADRTRENMVKLMENLEMSMVFVPVVTEGMTDEMKEAAKKNGKVELPQGAKVRNRLLVSKEGDTVFPVFTTPEEITNPELQGQFMLMPFIDCAKAATVPNSGVKAIIVNPFTDNVGLVDKLLEACVQRRAAIDNAMKQAPKNGEMKQVQVTEKQFHQLARTQTETLTIPKKFYEEKETFFDQLNEKKGALFMEDYKAFYADQLEIPFSEDDIKTMVLGVASDVKLAIVDLPSARMQEGMCGKIFMSLNETTKEAHYIVIQKTKDGMELAEFDADCKRKVIGEAPDEGTEMNAVMTYLGIE